jgi:hypothetical protein
MMMSSVISDAPWARSGIQESFALRFWIPAFAGMTLGGCPERFTNRDRPVKPADDGCGCGGSFSTVMGRFIRPIPI